MTELEVMAKLGLRPWDEVKDAARREAEAARVRTGSPVSSSRRSGRTWHMLVRAVMAVSQGEKVVIEAHCEHYERELYEQARDWCRRCGIDPAGLVRPKARGWRGRELVYFTDHYVLESLWQDIARGAV